MTVELKDGREFQGTTYGIDTLTDLAIVKIEGADLPAAPLGDSATLKPGQLAIAIGSPLGDFTNSVTTGVVSAMGRSIIGQRRGDRPAAPPAQPHPDGRGHQPRQLRRGAGGLAGQVIGVNTAVAGSAQGIGFAIPINIAKPIMQQAVAGEQLTRPWIGISLPAPSPRSSSAQANLPIDYGAWVSAGDSGGAGVRRRQPGRHGRAQGRRHHHRHRWPAHRRRPLARRHPRHYRPGDQLTLTVLRDGATLDLKVTLGTRRAT